VSYAGLQYLLDKHIVNGFDVDMSTDKPDCVACTEAKLTVKPYGPSGKSFTKPGKLTHVDLWGKYDKASIHGNSYYLLLVDNASRFTSVEFLKLKHQAVQFIKNYMTHLMACGMLPCAICMDRGTEFVNEYLQTWCHSKGIRYQMTAPHSPSQNSIAECMNRMLEELSRAMLGDSKLPKFL
jgi:Integrase core domain